MNLRWRWERAFGIWRGRLLRRGEGISKVARVSGDLYAGNGLDRDRIPSHIAIIMDGNGRWARERGLPRIAGHKAGVDKVREIVSACGELGVRFLTLYAFSTENWRRPPDEVSGLMSLFRETLEQEMLSLVEKNVRLRVIGRRDGLPLPLRNLIANVEEKTRASGGLQLNLAVNYGGRAEILDAVRSICEGVLAGDIDLPSIDEQLISDHLYTAGLPDPDLLIRTSGEMRLSNFLLWQVAYTELWTTPTLWPDFTREELYRAIHDYQGRERRFGGRPDPGLGRSEPEGR
ncbi:MAG: isoprenyl transferase [Firmicutes bacterium]|nr:isoprenyl transferase [Bacillota bacterium]